MILTLQKGIQRSTQGLLKIISHGGACEHGGRLKERFFRTQFWVRRCQLGTSAPYDRPVGLMIVTQKRGYDANMWKKRPEQLVFHKGTMLKHDLNNHISIYNKVGDR